MNIKRIVLVSAAGIALTVCGYSAYAMHEAAAYTPLPTAQAPTTTSTTVIQEDSPQWDCKTMGNKVCGSHVPTMGPEDYPFILALKPVPNSDGLVCWTEYNPEQPNNEEVICGDMARIDQQLDPSVWLHWNY